MAKRLHNRVIIAAVIVLGAVITWCAIPARPLDPTLPEIGPGAKRVSGTANIGAPTDAGKR